MSLTAGTRLGVYEITALIGAGGMGEVYRARDERLERTVAIKVLPQASSADAERRERFRREALALSRLSHPNVCAIHDIGTEDGIDYLVMELLDGETLAERLERGPLAFRAALDIALQIAGALDKTHRMGLAHRDLKPSNIMLTRAGAKLLDFGLARFALAGGEPSSQTVSDALTAHGGLLGTFRYMSPEALEGRNADARSDIFSFGAVLYEMVTGRRAFGGDSPASVIGAILKDDAPSILGVDSSASVQLDRIIRTCLSKDPDDRWQSAHDVRLELQWAAEMLERPRDRAPVARVTRRLVGRSRPWRLCSWRSWDSASSAARPSSGLRSAFRFTLQKGLSSSPSALMLDRQSFRQMDSGSPLWRRLPRDGRSSGFARSAQSRHSRSRALKGQPTRSGRRTASTSHSLPTAGSRRCC